MGKVSFYVEKCKGCELCTIVCPVKIIKMSDKLNKKGFNYAEVADMKKCTACGMCFQMCPDLVIEVEK